MRCLAVQTASAALFNGAAITGERLAMLMNEIVHALNEHGSISVPSVFRAMESETAARTATHLLSLFDTAISQLRSSLPLPRLALQARLASEITRMMQQYDESTADCTLLEERKKKRDELSAYADKVSKPS